ncbi:RNA polymerase sigma factor [Blastopirellula marina]|uniref:RNA polymerase subunit sigma n=1 Tax=Blastopirellula marina TaxID=124 RepID=A0A2S8GRQ8_9BACT|nr:sigma-70 family RNA polymerase sigma factor [Blastopirellula marina]PQO47110.1 RNA polymerase subunit sigma [Blastopirellula marina]
MSLWPDTHESLICRVKNPQDSVAWNQFMAIYRPVVFRLARKKGLQHADAEDLTQRVFVSIARAVGDWKPEEGGPRFRNWLGRIARNAILNALSREKPDKGAGSTTVDALLDAVSAEEDAETCLFREARLEAFRWAAARVQMMVQPETWNMFRLTAIEGRSVEEVAQQLNKTTGAVYIARCRVMQRIKDKVDEISDIWSNE